MDNEYSNREIDLKIERVLDKLDEIHKQTIKTNGRVTSLEAWRNRIAGAIAVMSVMILPILLYIANIIIGKILK